jgi:integrase
MQIVRDVFDYLWDKNRRDGLMYAMGIYIGLRISDILLLRVRDVKKQTIRIREQKTGKEKVIPVNKFLRKLIDEYVADMKDYEFLFRSPKKNTNKPITRQQAYNILSDAARNFGIEQGIGTHTMRKTFGYHYYQKTHDIASLMEIYNHDREEVTLRYIGITQDTISNIYNKINWLE